MVGSSSFLVVTKTTIISRLSSKVEQIGPPTAGLKIDVWCYGNSSSFVIDPIFFILGSYTTIISQMSSNFGQIGPQTVELTALERLEKSTYTYNYNGRNVVATLASLFFNGSSSVL